MWLALRALSVIFIVIDGLHFLLWKCFGGILFTDLLRPSTWVWTLKTKWEIMEAFDVGGLVLLASAMLLNAEYTKTRRCFAFIAVLLLWTSIILEDCLSTGLGYLQLYSEVYKWSVFWGRIDSSLWQDSSMWPLTMIPLLCALTGLILLEALIAWARRGRTGVR